MFPPAIPPPPSGELLNFLLSMAGQQKQEYWLGIGEYVT